MVLSISVPYGKNNKALDFALGPLVIPYPCTYGSHLSSL
jgi:hypothetical protein